MEPQPRLEMKWRLAVLAVMLAFYLISNWLGAVRWPTHHNSTGIDDVGHLVVPSLATTVGLGAAQYVLWLGTLPEESFFGIIAIVVLFTGRGARLALCVFSMYLLHWICFQLTTYPAPDLIVWHFPPGIVTFGRPAARDFWFSGHVANAFIIALATAHSRTWVKVLAWSFFAIQIVLVLSARTHYTTDIIGGIFVAYTFNRVSLDLAAAWNHRVGMGAVAA
jgi:hypothetical protein